MSIQRKSLKVVPPDQSGSPGILPAIDQIVSIFAGTKGFLDDVEVKHVAVFEKAMLEYMHASGQAVWDELAQKKAFDDEMTQKLTDALNAFKQGWKAPE